MPARDASGRYVSGGDGGVLGAESLVAKLGRITPACLTSVADAITRATIDLQSYVKGLKLSDQVLHVRSNVLRSSIAQSVDVDADGVKGTVGTNVDYAPPHEYGLTVQVPSYTRIITQAFGRELSAPVEVNVRAHLIHFKERSFLRSALADRGPTYQGWIKQAVANGVRDAGNS